MSFRLGFLPTRVPAAKLGIGLAFYGYCWQGVTAPHQDGGSISASDGTMSYATIATQYPVATTRQWDATAHVPYLSSVAGIGAQVVDYIQRDCFDDLDAPVVRVHQADVPMPYAKALEKSAKPDLAKTIAAVKKVMYVE